MEKREIAVEVPVELYDEIQNARIQGERQDDTIRRLLRRGVDSLSLPRLLTITTALSGVIWVWSIVVDNETISSLIGGFFIAFVGFWMLWRVLVPGPEMPEYLRS